MVAPVDDMLGRVLVGRTISRKLGEGGMGAVYLAEHSLATLKPYVVKVLHAEFARYPDIVDRLFQEAQTASKLNHPAIIDIVDCGRFPDGRPYIVMAFVAGVDLGDHCHAVGAQWGHPGRLPIALASPIVLQLCDGLRVTHAAGIIHRDLKLSNVMVVPDGPDGIALKILDFGIAKAPPELRVAEPTRTHQVFGTPGYMPPEQARGLAIDARADVYAVGVMLYRMLTGVQPFGGENAADVLINQVNTPPAPPHLLVSEIPVPVSELIVECLAPDPDQRPGTITEVANRWINAVSGAREVAGVIARGLLSGTGSADPTVRAPMVPRSVAPASVATREPRSTGTPMAGAVGAAPTAASQPARNRWPLLGAVALGSAAGVVAVVLLVQPRGSDKPDPSAGSSAVAVNAADAAPRPATDAMALAQPSPAIDAAPPSPPDAAPPPTVVDAGQPPDARPAPPRDDDHHAKKATGTLVVKASPFADVWVDGKYKGSTPLTVTLSEGKHTVKLKKPDSDPESVRVQIDPNHPATVSRL